MKIHVTKDNFGALRPADQSAKEEWRPVVGFSCYEVSNLGRVKRISPSRGVRVGHILKNCNDLYGYPSVWLRKDGKTYARKVHRLVAEAFLGPKPTPLHEVAHGDGNPANPSVDNLRWATRAENHADKIRHGTTNRGERHGANRLTVDRVREARRRRENGETIRSIAESFGVHRETVGMALRGKSWGWLK